MSGRVVRRGDRVELHPATDDWMRGDRFGEVIRAALDYATVRLDRSGKIKHYPYSLVTYVRSFDTA